MPILWPQPAAGNTADTLKSIMELTEYKKYKLKTGLGYANTFGVHITSFTIISGVARATIVPSTFYDKIHHI